MYTLLYNVYTYKKGRYKLNVSPGNIKIHFIYVMLNNIHKI